MKKILYVCITDYFPIDSGLFEKPETFQIFFSSDNSSDEEDKKMPARDIAGSGDDNDTSAAAGSPNESNDVIPAAPDPNMPVARYPSDIETEEVSIKNLAKDNYLEYLAAQFCDDDKKQDYISSDNIDSRKRPRVDFTSSIESNDGFMEVDLSEIREKESTGANVDIEKANSSVLSDKGEDIQKHLKQTLESELNRMLAEKNTIDSRLSDESLSEDERMALNAHRDELVKAIEEISERMDIMEINLSEFQKKEAIRTNLEIEKTNSPVLSHKSEDIPEQLKQTLEIELGRMLAEKSVIDSRLSNESLSEDERMALNAQRDELTMVIEEISERIDIMQRIDSIRAMSEK